MQWQTVVVFADEQVDHQIVAELAAGHDLVAERGPDQLGFAERARQLLAGIQPHDHLCRNEIDHLGRFMSDAGALCATSWTRSLSGGNQQRVRHARQMRRCRLPPRRPFAGLLGLWLVILGEIRCVAQPLVGTRTRIVVAGRHIAGLAARERVEE
jgi:hypothetical protein